MTVTHNATDYLFAERVGFENPAASEYFNELLRGMAHKQNNLLAVIQGFSSLLLMGDSFDESARENIQHMKEAAQGVGSLSEMVLSAGGCARISPQSVQLPDYLALIEGKLREPSMRLAVPFAIHLSPAVPPVSCDNTRLKEVLLALLSNAAEAASDAGGEMTLDVLSPGEVSPGSNRVDIFVRNTGTTVPAERLSKAFRPFYTTKDSTHFGIGLTAAAMLCGMMDIPIGLKSEGEITTAWLQLPVAG